jgi:hypothetical protein
MAANGYDIKEGIVFSNMDETEEIIGNNFENILEKDAKVGDVMAYGYTDIPRAVKAEIGLDLDKVGPAHRKSVVDEYKTKTGHYSVVLLKAKDGSKVQTVVEKAGETQPAVLNPRDNLDLFVPAKIHKSPANRAGYSPIYRKKQ